MMSSNTTVAAAEKQERVGQQPVDDRNVSQDHDVFPEGGLRAWSTIAGA